MKKHELSCYPPSLYTSQLRAWVSLGTFGQTDFPLLKNPCQANLSGHSCFCYISRITIFFPFVFNKIWYLLNCFICCRIWKDKLGYLIAKASLENSDTDNEISGKILILTTHLYISTQYLLSYASWVHILSIWYWKVIVHLFNLYSDPCESQYLPFSSVTSLYPLPIREGGVIF